MRAAILRRGRHGSVTDQALANSVGLKVFGRHTHRLHNLAHAVGPVVKKDECVVVCRARHPDISAVRGDSDKRYASVRQACVSVCAGVW
jgi:hypothetical protein